MAGPDVGGAMPRRSNSLTTLRLVSFRERRYTIRSLRPQTMSVALRQSSSVTGRSFEEAGDVRGLVGRINRHYVETGGGAAPSPGAVAVFQRKPASGTRRHPAVHRYVWCARDLRTGW